MNPRLPQLSIAVLSATALSYELLLMRLFSIIQWHHFAYMIISIALLGYGVSGTFLSLLGRRLLIQYRKAYLINIGLFAVSLWLCFVIAQQIHFNAEEMLWNPAQAGRLFIIYLLLSLPFFFVANAIGLTLIHYGPMGPRIYAADLVGAGSGSLAIVLLLYLSFPQQALNVLVMLALLALLLGAWELRLWNRRWLVIVLLTGAIPFALPSEWQALRLSPYKGLSQLQRIDGTHVVAEYSSPLGMLSVVQSSQTPLRHAPGLSLAATQEPPAQIAVFTDGDNMTPITALPERREQLAYLDYLTSALAYHLSAPQQVLILGAGGGADVLQAHYHQVAHVDAVEINPQLVALLRNDYRDFTGGLFVGDQVSLYGAEARGFVASSDKRYDLIQLSLLDAFAASSAGLYALNESYLYTVEALALYLSHLEQLGMLSITRWVELPPRDGLKMFNTAVQALRKNGVAAPEQHLLMIRGWQTVTVIVKNGAVTEGEISAMKEFCASRGFDLAYYPGIDPAETNRFNILPRPYYAEGALALLSDKAEQYLADYKFNLAAATDDRPYYHHFFKWGAIRELLSNRERGGMGMLEWGYLILIATLAQAITASLVLILLPLLWRPRDEASRLVARRTPAFVYFFLLGLAFLFLEIAFIQKFMQLLFHPLYAIAVVLCSFLVFAGLGSAWSQRYVVAGTPQTGVRHAVRGIVILGMLYLVLLNPLFAAVAGLPVVIKILLAAMLVAPLAFCMGMPFPLGLNHLAARQPELLPWVWGVNGCASVISAVLATVLAVHLGFSAVVLAALILYAMAVRALQSLPE